MNRLFANRIAALITKEVPDVPVSMPIPVNGRQLQDNGAFLVGACYLLLKDSGNGAFEEDRIKVYTRVVKAMTKRPS